MHVCVLLGSQNKQRLFLFAALSYRFGNRGRECLLRGANWVFNSDSYRFVLKRLNLFGLCNDLSFIHLFKNRQEYKDIMNFNTQLCL
jgi:hypothetical protein